MEPAYKEASLTSIENTASSLEKKHDKYETYTKTDRMTEMDRFLNETLEMIKQEDTLSDENYMNTSDEYNESADPGVDVLDDCVDTEMRFVNAKRNIKIEETGTKTRQYSLSDHLKENATKLEIYFPQNCLQKKPSNFVEQNNQCKICFKTYTTYYNLQRHTTKHTGLDHSKREKIALFKCDVCFKGFSKRYKLKHHESIHTGEKPFRCEECGMDCRTKGLLRNHKQKKHSDQRQTYKCTKCWKSFKTLSYMKSHMLIHRGTRFVCDLCGKTFSAKHTLAQHLKLHTNADNGNVGVDCKYFTCEICEKQFVCEETLKLHMEVHTGTQQYSCSTCNCHFSRKADLERHVTTHTGEKPYKCPECPLRFRAPGDLGRHKKVKHGDERTCPVCGKTFVRNDEFKRHVNGHAIENGQEETYTMFRCEICQLVLSNAVNLKRHAIVHEMRTYVDTMNKSAMCEICGRSFSTMGNKYKHMRRTHEIIKFTCDTCGKELHSKESLKNHVKSVHLKQLDHECTLCDRHFVIRSELNRHVLKIH